VAQRLGGVGFNALFRAFGGIGGAAAGAGNVVKMLVSRTGSLFGKTFGREVYTTIGRTLTKKALSRLTVAVTVIIELVVFLNDVHTWKGKLSEKVSEEIDKWHGTVLNDLQDQYLPRIREENERGVGLIYDGLIVENRKLLQLRSAEAAPQMERLDLHCTELYRISEMLKTASF